MAFRERNSRAIPDVKLRVVIYLIAGLILSLVQILVVDVIEFGGITPDLLILLCVWVAMTEGRFVGMIVGFAVGLSFDLISIVDLTGTNALTKTLAAFVAGSFHKEGRKALEPGKFRFLFVTFFASAVHNIVYFLLYLRFSELSFWNFIFKYGLAFSLYTTVISLIPIFLRLPKRNLYT